MYPPEINLMVTYHKQNYTTTRIPTAMPATTTTAVDVAIITTEAAEAIEATTATVDTVATEDFVVIPVSEATTTVTDGVVGGQLMNSNDVTEQTISEGAQKVGCKSGTYLPSIYCNKVCI